MSTARTAVVTGAAGNLGSAIVARLVTDGFAVVGVDIADEPLRALAERVEGVTTMVADISTAAGADAVVEQAGQVGVLVNNAGIPDMGATVDELSDDDWERVIAVNLTAAFRLTHRIVPGMLAAGGGVIVNMSSVAGLRGGRTGVAYTASKWALIGMTQNIAAHLGRDGIRCNAICPGAIERDAPLPAGFKRTPRAEATAGRDRFLPPRGTPADVANLVAFLVGEESSNLNGAAIPLDGGAIAF